MKVAEFMIPENKLVVCARNETLQEAVLKMLSKQVSSVVVVNDVGGLMFAEGVLTKTDALRALFINGATPSDPVEKVMSTHLVTISIDAQRGEKYLNFTHLHTHFRNLTICDIPAPHLYF
jgi:CBS domain-containing protein